MLSVPSAGLWAVELLSQDAQFVQRNSFSTLCGPMGCGTKRFSRNPRDQGTFSTLCGPMGCGTKRFSRNPPVRPAFSTLCGPMGCGTATWALDGVQYQTFSTLCGPMGCGTVRPLEPTLTRGSFSTLCGPMGCGTPAVRRRVIHCQDLSVPSAGLWAVEPDLPFETQGQSIPFQYPLRAYGLWNLIRARATFARSGLSVPSAGLWAVEPPRSRTPSLRRR